MFELFNIRIIPVLLLRGRGLVKTIQFKDPKYLGDPINIVRIFNEKEVHEIILLDIEATIKKRPPVYELIEEIASECFMPLGYGGGVQKLEEINQLFNLGVEKIIINNKAVKDPNFIKEASKLFGSQSIVVSLDIIKTSKGPEIFVQNGKVPTGLDPRFFSKYMEQMGAGELFINSIDRDGTMMGYDNKLVEEIASSVSIPVIACGGAGKIEDFVQVVKNAGASAAAAGSIFVFQGKLKAVLVSFPKEEDLEKAFS